jgi:hypothetical protein
VDNLLVEQRRWAKRRVPRSHPLPLGAGDAALLTLRLERRGNGRLQVSRRYLAFLHGVEPLEELIEAEGDVVSLLLLLLLSILP